MKFLSSLVILMAVILAAVYLGTRYWDTPVPSYTLEIVFFLAITTAIFYFILVSRSGSEGFTQAYLLSIVLKMIVFSTFVLVIIFLDKPGAFSNALLFMGSYVLLTALEVGFLFHRINW